MAVFETSLVLNITPEKAFDFLILPVNIARISPPQIGLKFVNPPDALSFGVQFEVKVQAWGTVQTSVFEVIEFERPHCYIEKQFKGPMKSWIHEHRYTLNSDGQTIISNRIEFTPPGGLVGLMVTESKIIDNLEDGFYYRHQQLRKLLEGTP